MNFLWDIALRASQQGTKEEELFFCQAEAYSPFYEQAFPCLNETRVEGGEVELNLLFRFADIFQYLTTLVVAEHCCYPVRNAFNR